MRWQETEGILKAIGKKGSSMSNEKIREQLNKCLVVLNKRIEFDQAPVQALVRAAESVGQALKYLNDDRARMLQLVQQAHVNVAAIAFRSAD